MVKTLKNMRKLHVFLFVLSFCTIVDAGSGQHSLYVLATCLTGETPFPEFTAVVMLDDVQVGYFDSKINKVVRFGHDIERKEIDITPAGVDVIRSMYVDMRERLTNDLTPAGVDVIRSIQRLTNDFKDIQVQQRKAGCEMLLSDEGTLIMFQESNAMYADADTISDNMKTSKCLTGSPWKDAIPWDEILLQINTMRYTREYIPICFHELKNLLEKEKKVVLHSPRVLFLEKVVPGGAQVSCLATDFYPRHINLTLLRDGHPVAEQELTGGAVLPNGNGLYQVRKTLEITTQELRERHDYTCTASHLSLDNKLDISWQPDFSREHRVPILLSSVAMWIFFILIIFCFGVKMRKHPEPRTPLQSANTDAQVTETLNPSSNSDT